MPTAFSLLPASVAIIGGADGPTAVYVTASPSGLGRLVIVALLAAALLAGRLIWKKRRR